MSGILNACWTSAKRVVRRNRKNTSVDSRIVLVTGANTGIGFELVRLLAENGHTVYLGARNSVSGKEAEQKLHSAGLKTVKFVELDITKVETIHSARDAISKQSGKLDVLINNAGISNLGKDQSAKSVDISLIRETMETNLYGLVETTKTFLPLLRKSTTGSPVILNVSTDMASNSNQSISSEPIHVVAYNTSKTAANSYTIALAHELKEEGFKVNAVTPGFTSTKLNYFAKGGQSPRDGASALLPWALLGKDAETGLFVNSKGEEFPW